MTEALAAIVERVRKALRAGDNPDSLVTDACDVVERVRELRTETARERGRKADLALALLLARDRNEQ